MTGSGTRDPNDRPKGRQQRILRRELESSFHASPLNSHLTEHPTAAANLRSIASRCRTKLNPLGPAAVLNFDPQGRTYFNPNVLF
jgi:hypothetical protein